MAVLIIVPKNEEQIIIEKVDDSLTARKDLTVAIINALIKALTIKPYGKVWGVATDELLQLANKQIVENFATEPFTTAWVPTFVRTIWVPNWGDIMVRYVPDLVEIEPIKANKNDEV